MNVVQRSALAVVCLALMTALTSCTNANIVRDGGNSSPTPSVTVPDIGMVPDETLLPKITESWTAGVANDSGYIRPKWAAPIVTRGVKLGSVVADGYTVDVFQAAIAKNSKTSTFVDAKTKRALLEIGDPITYLNFVVTNTSDTDLKLKYSLIRMEIQLLAWPYGTLAYDNNLNAYIKAGINTSAVSYDEPEPYTLPPGESFASGQNVPYEKGRTFFVTSKYYPLDANSESVYSEPIEATGQFVMH